MIPVQVWKSFTIKSVNPLSHFSVHNGTFDYHEWVALIDIYVTEINGSSHLTSQTEKSAILTERKAAFCT